MATRVPPAEITGPYGALVKWFSKRTLGEVPESLGVSWNNPKVLKGLFAVSTKAKKWDACDESLKSFAHMAVASKIGCTWCLDYGYFEAHNRNLDIDKAREIPRWRESDAFTPLERDVLEYAEAMTETPPTVADELSERLLKQLGAPALVELTSWIAVANLWARNNVALGIESEGYAKACGLRDMPGPAGARELASAA